MSEETIGSSGICVKDGECLRQINGFHLGFCCSGKHHKTLRCNGLLTGFHSGLRCGAALEGEDDADTGDNKALEYEAATDALETATDDFKALMSEETIGSSGICVKDGECLRQVDGFHLGFCCSGKHHKTLRCNGILTGFHSGLRCGVALEDEHEDEAATNDLKASEDDAATDDFKALEYEGATDDFKIETAADDFKALMSEETIGSSGICVKDGECLRTVDGFHLGICCSGKHHKTLRCNGILTGAHRGLRCGAAQFLV